jgi:hypothetical protein
MPISHTYTCRHCGRDIAFVTNAATGLSVPIDLPAVFVTDKPAEMTRLAAVEAGYRFSVIDENGKIHNNVSCAPDARGEDYFTRSFWAYNFHKKICKG